MAIYVIPHKANNTRDKTQSLEHKRQYGSFIPENCAFFMKPLTCISQSFYVLSYKFLFDNDAPILSARYEIGKSYTFILLFR